MTDTRPEINDKVAEMMMRRSGVERLKMGCSMFDMAKKLVLASLAGAAGDNVEVRRLLFLRFYQDCFDSEKAEKALGCLVTR